MFSLTTLAPIALLTLSTILQPATARRGLNPGSLPLLTRGTDYTFHSICEDFHYPDLFFDELVLFPLHSPPFPLSQ